MKYPLTGFAVCLFFLTAVTSLSAQQKNSVQGDFEALADLYSATNGDNWRNNSGWLKGKPSNRWYGVEVDNNGRVIRLDLYKNNLTGELPESIGNLTQLRFFSVKRNPIYSEIPTAIENWVNAEIVLFSSGSDYNMPNESTYNDHYGKEYGVTPTKYFGAIPDVFDKMPNLRIFEIAWSEDLDLQPFPSTLYKHSSLEILTLTATNLIGELEDNFNLPELKWIYIGNNHLSGNIPNTFGLSTELRHFRIHNGPRQSGIDYLGYFSGPIPDSFANLTKLERFYAGEQNLSGKIPAFVIDKWPLRGIDIGSNNFEGTVPKEFGNKDLYRFTISHNNFTGELHPNIAAGMQRIIIFNVRGNNFSGNFPNGQLINGEWKGWRTKTRLRTVTIDHNNFTGPLPDMPEYVGDMSLFTAHSNNFTGGIPDTWKELFTPELRNENPKRTFNNLQLRGNQLQGILPAWFTSENIEGNGIDIKGNRWSRNDILKNGVRVGTGEQHDATQLPFGQQILYKRPAGSSIEYDYSHKVHPTDKIRWSKWNDSTGEWERDERFDDKVIFSISGIKESDYGSYRMELTNTRTRLPDMIVSEPIVIEESDGNDVSGGFDETSENKFPEAPEQTFPSYDEEKTSLTPEFGWSDIGADYYVLHVSRMEPTGMTLDVIVKDTTFTPDEIFDDNTVHDWRVRGVKDGEPGKWSDIQRFTTSKKNLPEVADLLSPGHSAQNIDPATDLMWEDTGADSYELRIMDKKTSDIILSDALSDTSYIPNEILPDTTDFVWQVKSIVGGVHGAWGPRWEFSTGVYQKSTDSPALILPENGSATGNPVPTFKWEDVEADQYIIMITRDNSTITKRMNGKTSQSTSVIQEEITGTTYTPETSLEPETNYYWRVRAVKDGEKGEWSEPWEFTLMNLSVPVLFGPDDHSKNVSISPEFTWSDTESDYYILHVNRLNPTGMILDVIVNDTTFTPDDIFDDNTIHDWRVRGVKDGKKGEWSNIQRFTTRDENLPDIAGLVAPGHFAQNVDQSAELAWEDAGADRYEIRIMDKKTSDILFSDILPDTSYIPVESLPDTTDFVWQVKSIAAGVHGAWGPRWEFSTNVYGIDPPALISPKQGGEYSNLVPTFEWEEAGADHYVISITRDDPTSGSSVTVIQEEISEATFTPEISLEPEIKYYWQVQAVEDGEESEWSDLWEFTLMNPIAAQKVMSSPTSEQESVPVSTSLDQNYPNPFNPTTQIEFALSGAQKVSLKVYDMAGRQVAKLVDGVLEAGHHTATFDASHLSSGIYIYQFISNTHQFSRKMTLIK